MKKFCVLVRYCSVGVLAFAFFGSIFPSQASDAPQVIQVLQVKGQARYADDAKVWRPMKKGLILQPGVIIQTAQNSSVDLQLGDQNIPPIPIDAPNGSLYSPDELKANSIRLYDNSVLNISGLTSSRAASGEVSETQLDLRNGRMMGAVRKSFTTSRYEVKFAKGVVGLRDGVYLMNSSGAVDVLYGTAMVACEAANGATPVRIVAANHQFDPGTGVVSEIAAPIPVEPSVPQRPPASAPTPGAPFQGPGMGGALRKF